MTIRAQEPSSVHIELKNIGSDAEETYCYRSKRFSFVNSSLKLLLLGNMEPQSGETTYQPKGNISGIICTEAQECVGTVDFFLL
ncbi:hypothetical protein AYI69_g1046 [Smittium culicis]|uniref:Uncharacterized protein n=1 Tax=Smittium culicis TaxID=133412 RepID=A0A1R1YRP0_9FUNG|nr:hypothetical protein AYI69_g1046 [Smittium culicis]